ncbi:MAG: alkyl hydroperoxide reductase subunit alkyl hydroperoxide reductase subunit [Candidatus Adlerbacteria bacterium]|nr:alkyl hydroperoxide reductase subunit alkyl hydroperoxide reductase subunit [Candidatus Adlerbacteria bacterium]
MYDLAIIGGGPAGVAAGVYAARKRLKTVFIAETFGGQSTDSLDIQNWIGIPHIPGPALAKALEAHLREYASDIVDLKAGERAATVEKSATGFAITTQKGSYEAKTVLIATGGSRRKLGIPGAEQYENKGIVYCASCDGPLFAGQDTVVIGAGNAGFETAAQLLAYAKSVTLLNRSSAFDKADAKTVEAVRNHPNMTILADTEPVEVKGTMFVNALTVKNTKTGETKDLPAGGIFVEIGALPATGLVKDLVEFDPFNHIKVDPRTQRASVAGVWAAGDCTDGLYHQNNIAAGDAVKALEDIYLYIKSGS